MYLFLITLTFLCHNSAVRRAGHDVGTAADRLITTEAGIFLL
jgi:hypothetical protein